MLDYGVLISSEQFDMIVKIMNSALVDEKVAMVLLPLTTIIYRVGGFVMDHVEDRLSVERERGRVVKHLVNKTTMYF